MPSVGWSVASVCHKKAESFTSMLQSESLLCILLSRRPKRQKLWKISQSRYFIVWTCVESKLFCPLCRIFYIGFLEPRQITLVRCEVFQNEVRAAFFRYITLTFKGKVMSKKTLSSYKASLKVTLSLTDSLTHSKEVFIYVHCWKNIYTHTKVERER